MDSKEEKFSRYVPQHPLPDEIKNLARDDTVCRYCGISYLIHNEIKALEEKLQAAEKELVMLRGLEKREELLKQENTLLKQQKDDLQANIETVSKLVETLKEQSKTSEESATSYRKKYILTLRHLSTLSQTARQQRQSLQDIRQKLTSTKSEISENIHSCLQKVMLITEFSVKESSDLQSKIQCLDMEKLVLSESNKKLMENLKQKEQEFLQTGTKLQEHEENVRKLENNQHEKESLLQSLKTAETGHNELKKELEESQSQCRTLTIELDQYKIQMRNKTTEINNMTNKQKQLEQAHEVAVQKLNLELRAKESELGSCMKQLKTLENQVIEFQKKESEVAQQSKLGLRE